MIPDQSYIVLSGSYSVSKSYDLHFGKKHVGIQLGNIYAAVIPMNF